MAGFVVMDRAAIDHPLLQDAERFRAWFWLVAKACWKPTRFDIGGKTITLERGQLCASRSHLAEAWGWSESAVERFLSRLKTEQMIGRATGQGKSIITICNYGKYQDFPEEAGQATGQATGQRSDSDRTAKEQGNHLTKEKGTSSYAFEGRTIRLTQADYDRWRKRYFTITDLDGELSALDDWFESQTDETRKKWFHITSASLNKKHQANLAKAAKDEEWELPIA